MDEREAAWASLHDVVAAMPGWAVGPCTFHGEVARWYVAVIHVAVRGRQAKREAIEATGATGATEVAALRALAELLEQRAVACSRAELNRRLRAAFVEGAEEDSRRRLGRGLTEEELERVLGRYPGEVGSPDALNRSTRRPESEQTPQGTIVPWTAMNRVPQARS